MKTTSGISHFLPLFLLASAMTGSPCRSQDEATAVPRLRTEDHIRFSQYIDAGKEAAAYAPKSEPIPPRRTLDFTVPNLKPAETPGAAVMVDLRQQLLNRMEKAHATVMKCVLDENGKPRPDTGKVLAELQALREAEPEESEPRRDLDNLVIAGLSEVQVNGMGSIGRSAEFKVWSYRILGETEPATRRLCGPTITAHPDSVLFIPVVNLLNKDDLKMETEEGTPLDVPPEVSLGALPNTPHGFDVINLHTHGLNVSPSWPADDVFREIHPYQLKFFVYEIRKDHPTGTFWYHPHKHGAASSQVAGGMAGPLLVKGKDEPLGLDEIGGKKGWVQQDEPLLLQQLFPYRLAKQSDANKDLFAFRPDFLAVRFIGSLKQQGANVVKIKDLVTSMTKLTENITPTAQNWISGRLAPELRLLKTRSARRARPTVCA